MLMSLVKSSCALQKFPSVKMFELEDKIEIEKKKLAKGKDKSKQETPHNFLEFECLFDRFCIHIQSFTYFRNI